MVNIDSVLQQFIYINRADKQEYDEGQLNTPGVRKYYTVINPSLLDDPMKICDKFSRILKIWNLIQGYPITKLLLKFNENFKLFLISYLFRVSEDNLSEQGVTPIMISKPIISDRSYHSRFRCAYLCKMERRRRNCRPQGI